MGVGALLALAVKVARRFKSAEGVIFVAAGVRRSLRFEMPGDPFGLHAGLLGEVLMIEQIAFFMLPRRRLGGRALVQALCGRPLACG